jgi:N-acetylglucosaminyl-diphospho-decaprenol L-rhamnosyltransferase
MARALLSTVIVAHHSLAELRIALPPLIAQLDPEDELIIVDNASQDGLAGELGRIAPRARLVTLSENVGFAAGANRGAAVAARDVLVLLNPDAVVQPGWADAIRAPWEGPWAAWMALVLLEDGGAINTSGGVLHFTGFGWAGQIGEPIARAPQAPREVGFLSGACLALPRATWNEVGGFPEQFFMYCEDVDLSLKLRLRGHRLGIVPAAKVVHDYEFAKGAQKWRLLERNRWAVVLRTYPTSLLVLVLPALIVAEAAVWAIALRAGWARMKARATLDVLRALPRLRRERRVIQASRLVDARTVAAGLTDELSSPYFGAAGQNRVARVALHLYWTIVQSLLRWLPDRP